MKFKRDQVIKCANEANKLYTVIGYNAGGNIILIPHGSEKKREERVVKHSDIWLYVQNNN